MEKRVRYCVRCPFPDEDLWCFVLDKEGKVRYYDNVVDAEAEAYNYDDATVMECTYYGF